MTFLISPGCHRARSRHVRELTLRLQQAMRHNQFEEAENIADQILKDAPQNEEARSAMFECQVHKKDLERAQETVRRWRSDIARPRAKLEEADGDLAVAQGDEQRAVYQWQKALALDPHDERVLRKLAELEHKHGHWSEEVAAWSALLGTDKSSDAHLHRAIALRLLHSWKEAFADLQTAQSMAAPNPEIEKWSAQFERLGKFLDEIRELDAKISTSPADVAARGDQALLFLRAHDPELALPAAQEARRLATWAIRPRLLYGLALLQMDREDECEALLMRDTLRLEQLSPEVLENLRRLDDQIGVERNNPDFFVSRAWQLNEIGQPALARQDAESALGLDGKSSGACAELSYALMKLGQPDEALTKIKLATDFDAQSATAWQYRGEIEMTRGEAVAAVDSLSRALSLNQTAIALQKRAQCYRKLGYHERAQEDLHALDNLTARPVH